MAYPTTLVSVTTINKVKVVGNGPSGIDDDISNPETGTAGGSLIKTSGIGQSSNGRFIVFVSEATNFDGLESTFDTDREIFLKDMTTGSLKRINLNLNSDSSYPTVSDDGRFVTYQTGDTIYRQEVPASGALPAAVVVTLDGSDPQMSANGQFIIYTGGDKQIYLKDMNSEDAAVLVSQDSFGNIGNTTGSNRSSNAQVSNDGKFVVFTSSSDNFLDIEGNSINANASTEIYLKNILTGELSLISADADGGGGVISTSITPASASASFSANGRYVVFESNNNDFVPNGASNTIVSAIYRKDLVTGDIELVSQGKSGLATSTALSPSVTADGRFVLFYTSNGIVQDGNLIPEALENQAILSPNYYSYWYIKDMANGDVYNLDLASGSTQFKPPSPFPGITIPAGPKFYASPFISYNAIISADGKYVTLSSTQSLDKGTIPNTQITSEGANFTDNNDEQFDVFRISVSAITSKAAVVQTRTGTIFEDSLTNGNDTLTGGFARDKLVGLSGNDTYQVELIKLGAGAKATAALKYTVVEAPTTTKNPNAGNDTINLTGEVLDLAKPTLLTIVANVENLDASATGSTKLNINGNALANNIVGNDADNILTGGAEFDTFVGGDGDDTYVLDKYAELDYITENEDEGTDTIQLTEIYKLLEARVINLSIPDLLNVENVKVTGTGLYNIIGNDLNNALTGNASVNSLTGGNGNDTLDGSTGADRLDGGDGNDTYVIDNLGDIITEDADGVDTVVTSLNNYILRADLEWLTLIGKAIIGTGNSNNNIIIGNASANTLYGLEGNDVLDGRAGADKLIGGNGDDAYLVDNVADKIIELSEGGIDSVASLLTYSLVGKDNLENLALAGWATNINGTGNALNNTITGSEGNNVITGGDGLDTLNGFGGSDIYIVAKVSEKTGAEINDTGSTGIDELRFAATSLSNIDDATLTLDAGDTGLERVTIGTGTAANAVLTGKLALNIDAAAATQSLIITGNAGINSLIGGLGDDSIFGGLGNDNLYGNAGADKLDGGAGNDYLEGGEGNDSFVFNIALNATTNVDTIADFENDIDTIVLDRTIFTKLSIDGLTGILKVGNVAPGAGNAAELDANDYIYYHATTGDLYYDKDGSGSGAAVKFATLIGAPEISADDFITVA